MTIGANLYVAELVNRQPRGRAQGAVLACAPSRRGLRRVPARAPLGRRRRPRRTPRRRRSRGSRVDTHDAADVLRKVQDDLDRLDVATFRQQWGIR